MIYIILALISLAMNHTPTGAMEMEQIVTQIDQQVPTVMSSWQVPGMSVAIVQNDKVVFSKGYGVQKYGDGQVVDTETLFAIGSVTKSFTSAALALILEQANISFDTPVCELLPEIRWNSDELTLNMTITDLLSHRTGLEKGDLVWFKSGLDKCQLLTRLQYLKSETPFRSTFSYNNLAYMTAGEIIPRTTGQTWSSWVQNQLLDPLKMTRTATSVAKAETMDNIAYPHSPGKGKHAIQRENNDVTGPSAAIYSSVNDMTNWVRLMLGKGTFEGKEILSQEILNKLWTPAISISLQSEYGLAYPKSTEVSYGHGWFIYDYAGRKVVEHLGLIDGMHALVILVPEENVGMVILSNSDSLGHPLVLKYQFLDQLFDQPYTDWNAYALAGVEMMQKQIAGYEMFLEQNRVKGTSPSLPLASYAGVWNNPLYGALTITVSENELKAKLLGLEGSITHWENDTFRWDIDFSMTPIHFVKFKVGPQGTVESVEITGQDIKGTFS